MGEMPVAPPAGGQCLADAACILCDARSKVREKTFNISVIPSVRGMRSGHSRAWVSRPTFKGRMAKGLL